MKYRELIPATRLIEKLPDGLVRSAVKRQRKCEKIVGRSIYPSDTIASVRYLRVSQRMPLDRAVLYFPNSVTVSGVDESHSLMSSIELALKNRSM